MDLRTLGGFELTDIGPDGQTVRVMGTQKPLALVAYLALAREHRASRDLIQELLWGDADPERGRKTLRQTVWSIRQRLGESALHSDGDDLVLDLPLSVDCQQFEADVAAGDLTAAWAAYRGHFIPSFATPGGAGFEQWADLQRDHYRALWLTVGEELVRRELAGQNYREAVAIATRLRDELPDRLDLWRVLLQALLASGQRMQALVEAETLETRLRAEQQRPDPETSALLDRIRALPPGVNASTPERPRSDLVGREQVFASLLGAWQAAQDGNGRAVVLRGAAGIGKTRLLHDLNDRLAGMGVRTVAVRARPADRDLPFGLVATLAEELARLPGAMGVSPAGAAALVDLAPSLSSQFSRTERPPQNPEELPRLRTLALAELVEVTADESPAAILVDDLHWADDASRQVLRSLSGRVTNLPVLLLLALRPVRGGWPVPAGVDLIELQPLTLSQLEDLVASVAVCETELQEDLARMLYAVSAGVPLLVLSAIELALERRLLRIEQDEWVCPNPDLLQRGLAEGSVLEQLLRELPVGGLEMLVALAVAGRPLDDEALAAVSDHPGGAALGPALEQRGLVVRLGDSWDVAHDKLAEAALAIASPAVQRFVGQRLGKALREGPDRSPRALRLAGRLLVTAGDPDGAVCFREWLVASHRESYWRDVVGAAAEFLGQDATVDLARQLARTIPPPVRLTRGYPRVAAGLGLVVLAGIGTAAVRLVDRWMEPPARTIVIAAPATSRGFLWDTTAASHLDSGATRNAVPLTIEFIAANGQQTRNAPTQVEVGLVDSPSQTLEGTLVQPVHRGRASFPDLAVRGKGPFRLEARAGALTPARTPLMRASGGFGHLEPHQMVITGGELNGQKVDSAHRIVRVSPGAVLSGSLRYRVLTTSHDAAILMGAVALWGDRQTNWIVLTALPSHGTTEVAMPLEDKIRGTRFTAPMHPGRYPLVIVMQTETEMRFIASRTNWTIGAPRWNDGDDIADMPQTAIDSLGSVGWVSWPLRNFQKGDGPDGRQVGAVVIGTALEIQVEQP
jgi:DNA-binding SARP family transcriptional activator